MPVIENSLSRRAEVAAARKLWPAATATTFSPSGRAKDHSPLSVQLSNGRKTTMLGASALALLAYSGPCSSSKSCCQDAAARMWDIRPPSVASASACKSRHAGCVCFSVSGMGSPGLLPQCLPVHT